MKGIILAGGSGTRLYPLTKIISKQLLPVYDKPMICYPMATLMLLGIKEILIISTPEDTTNISRFFGDGSNFGIHIEYAIQQEPKGIAEALIIGADFIGDNRCCLMLGDNILHMGSLIHTLREKAESFDGATIMAYHVRDPRPFGVIEFDSQHNIISIEEKPEHPKSNYASVGLYFYDKDVSQYASNMKPSARGELEITDLNNIYLQKGKLRVALMKRGTAWLDAGTPESLLEASNYVGTMEKRQGLKMACLEEIAYRRKYITKEKLQKHIDQLKDGSEYKYYLKTVITDEPG